MNSSFAFCSTTQNILLHSHSRQRYYLAAFFGPSNFQDFFILEDPLAESCAIFCSKYELKIAILLNVLGFFCFFIGSWISGTLLVIGFVNLTGRGLIGDGMPAVLGTSALILCFARLSSVWLSVKDLKYPVWWSLYGSSVSGLSGMDSIWLARLCFTGAVLVFLISRCFLL